MPAGSAHFFWCNFLRFYWGLHTRSEGGLKWCIQMMYPSLFWTMLFHPQHGLQKIHLPSWSCFFLKRPLEKTWESWTQTPKKQEIPPHHINLAKKSLISSSIFIDSSWWFSYFSRVKISPILIGGLFQPQGKKPMVSWRHEKLGWNNTRWPDDFICSDGYGARLCRFFFQLFKKQITRIPGEMMQFDLRFFFQMVFRKFPSIFFPPYSWDLRTRTLSIRPKVPRFFAMHPPFGRRMFWSLGFWFSGAVNLGE